MNGPYLPLYGLSLCVLFVLSFIDVSFIPYLWLHQIVLFVFMSICITAMEFVAGIIFIKGLKIKLWDYSNCWGNIKGIICPQYSFYWIILSAVYYFFIHPQILEWLYWFTNHLAFCLVIGFFYGVFTMDACYTFNVSAKIREFAEEKQIEIRYENLKADLRKRNEERKEKWSFLFQFRTGKHGLHESMSEIFKELFHS